MIQKTSYGGKSRLGALKKEWDLEAVVNFLFSHTLPPITQFLKDNAIPHSGSKRELQKRVRESIERGVLEVSSIVKLLDDLDGWGNQHVYLYTTTVKQREKWRDEKCVRANLAKIDAEELFNTRIPLILPDEATLSTVEWNRDRIRFVWVEKRTYSLRRTDLDHSDVTSDDDNSAEDIIDWNETDAGGGNIEYRAYEERIQRAITSFDWNLANGQASLLIHRLPTGEKYSTLRRSFEKLLEPVIPFDDFQKVNVARGIKKIAEGKEASNRQLEDATIQGGQARFTSRGRKADVNDDPGLRKAKAGLGETTPLMGNFYWQTVPNHLERETRTKLYAIDNRIGIFGERTEKEVNYVLSRIRFHCR